MKRWASTDIKLTISPTVDERFAEFVITKDWEIREILWIHNLDTYEERWKRNPQELRKHNTPHECDSPTRIKWFSHTLILNLQRKRLHDMVCLCLCFGPQNASSLTFLYITPVIPVLSLSPVTKQYWKCWWSMRVCSTAQVNIKAAIKNPHQAGASLFLMKLINTLFFRTLGKEKEKKRKHTASLMGHNIASLSYGILPHPLSSHKK